MLMEMGPEGTGGDNVERARRSPRYELVRRGGLHITGTVGSPGHSYKEARDAD
jgi:hypothetical protein